MNRLSLDQNLPRVARVYDILNCGPRNVFVANGKLVHNSGGDKVNLQNLPRGGALRNAITAPDGYMLVACDSSQIEARMVGWAAGQDDLTAAFAAGDDIYSLFASDVYGRKIVKGVDTIERHVGKTCLAEGTPVLCERGWVPIEQVTTSDRVWDGVEWVCHAGLVMNGWKQTLPLCGIWLTPDHLVWSGTQWLEAQSVVDDERNLSLALATAAENLPSLGISQVCVAITSETSERSKHLRKRLRVYDLASCGPRHRFTVKTERGPLIVHNCILGLGYGMSAAKFKISLKNGKPSVDLPDDECQGIVELYRRKYAKIKAFWKQCHNAMLAMYEGRRFELIDGLVYTDGTTIVLPNGMRLRYPGLDTEDGKNFSYLQRKKRIHVYGAKITENLIQALARIVVFDQMRAISKRYKVVLTVHDEVVICVPETEVQEAMAFMTEQMSIAPQWATGLPITCEAGYGKTYGECK